MKLTKLTLLACGLTLANGQGLYNISNLYALDEESSPLSYTLGVRYGNDSNVTPIGSESSNGNSDSASYISSDISAGFSHNESNYSLSAYATAGVIHYLDEIDGVESTNPIFGGGLNFSYSFNDRIRFNTRNYVNYGFEPDYEQGIANDRRSELYTAYQSNNDIGVRWSERFATVHGIGLFGADYGDSGSFNSTSLYNQIRYRMSPRTILTGDYAYRINESSDMHTYSVGVEHSFTKRTGFGLKVGAQSISPDSGESRTSPYVHASVKHKMSQQFSVSGYLNYGLDDNFTSLLYSIDDDGTTNYARYTSRRNLRLGLRANYIVSERMDLFGGVALVNSDYQDIAGVSSSLEGLGLGDASALIYNLNIGFRYGLTNTLSLIGSYNYSKSSSDEADPYDYTRNRYSLGLEASF